MRFRSQLTNGYQVFAVSGVNTISFAIDAAGANTAGLLGFAVERVDPTENERYYMYLAKYSPGKLRYKRVQEYKKMQGFA